MASRHAPSDVHDSSGSVQSPPTVSLSDKLLGSVIPLPDQPCIVYSVYTPVPGSPSPCESIELARRMLLDRNRSQSLLDSWLSSVLVKRESALYVYSIVAQDHLAKCHSDMNGLHFDGLHVSETSLFSPKDIYPCSLACANHRKPCQVCLESPHSPTPATSPSRTASSCAIPSSSPVCLLPRQPLRRIFFQFLEALRDRIINDISDLSRKNIRSQFITRFKNGFLLGQVPCSFEYHTACQHQSHRRWLTYCHLDIHLTSSSIIVHPILRPTHFLPLHTSLPTLPGTPITLVPFSVPAYILSTYSGPTTAITAQFDQYLFGLGVGDWKLPLSYHGPDTNDDSSSTPYLVVWVNVENKQGEEKGMTVIWPARLCLSFHSSSTSAHARTPLPYLPPLPSQLQPSPKIPLSSIPTVEQEQKISSSNTTRTPESPSRRRACRTPTHDSLRAFRSITVALSKDINRVAAEVGGYVDAVAKEREKERERIRREREMASTSASPRIMSATSAPPPGPSGPVVTPGQTPGPVRNEPTDGPPAPAPVFLTPPIQIQAPVAAVEQSPHPNFYPSPPQSNIPQTETMDAMQTSPEVVVAPLPDNQTSPSQIPAEAIPAASSASYDPFTNLGTSTWSQEADGDFLGMDVDFRMGDFDLGLDPIASSGGGGGGGGGIYDRGGMEQDDTFTDDDFSFFDRPSGPAPINVSTPLNSAHNNANLAATTDPSPLTFPSPLFSSALPGPPSFTMAPSNLMSPWAPGPLGDALTPRFTPAEISYTDTLASSPARTPWSRSAPSSPIVQLLQDQNRTDNRGSSIFDPIPFARSHRLSDGKYSVGKFALPSPPDEEDRTEAVPTTLLLSPPRSSSGWQYRYNAVTDPRIGVARKLAGSKRKYRSQGGQKPVKRLWNSDTDDYPTKADKSEAESDDEMEENESPMISRPSTPLSGYLLLGPTLLCTRFQHSQLLPLTTPLRPPGAAVAPTNITSPPSANSVPTPVSPAAFMGAASEKSKSLEAAAQIVAREVVENAIWANAWRANIMGPSSLKHSGDIWQADVMAVKGYLEGIAGPGKEVDIAELFVSHDPMDGDDVERPLRSMESPMISVAKANAVIQILPTALRFWEKLGLGPRGGKKDVTAFVLFENEDAERLQQAERWLNNMSAAYTGKRFGRHIAGNCSAAIKPGLVPLRFDAFRKNILGFIANLTNVEGHLVLYVVTPPSAMSLASPLLRQFLAGLKRTLKVCVGVPVFHFVPEYIVFGSLEEPAAYTLHLESLCFSLYDRILQHVNRVTSRHLLESEEVQVRSHIQEPSFTLARPIHSKVKFVWQAPARSLDVMDRHTLLHVGYQVTPCGKWIVAACIDERGEGHDVGVWLTQSEAHEAQLVSQVWNFALRFARRANVEWRIAIAKLGTMKEVELSAWMVHLENTVSTCQELSMFHVSLLCVNLDVPWTFTMPHDTKRPMNNRRTSLRDKSGLVIVDSSASTYAFLSKARVPLSSAASCFRELSSELCFIPEADDAADGQEPSLLPLLTSTLIRVPTQPGLLSVSMLQVHLLHTIKSIHSSSRMSASETHADITKNYHSLALLTRYRWRMEVNPILPFHLAALEAVQVALGRGDSIVD